VIFSRYQRTHENLYPYSYGRLEYQNVNIKRNITSTLDCLILIDELANINLNQSVKIVLKKEISDNSLPSN